MGKKQAKSYDNLQKFIIYDPSMQTSRKLM